MFLLHSVPDLFEIYSFARSEVIEPNNSLISLNKDSAKLDPMNPATPVISQTLGLASNSLFARS